MIEAFLLYSVRLLSKRQDPCLHPMYIPNRFVRSLLKTPFHPDPLNCFNTGNQICAVILLLHRIFRPLGHCLRNQFCKSAGSHLMQIIMIQHHKYVRMLPEKYKVMVK